MGDSCRAKFRAFGSRQVGAACCVALLALAACAMPPLVHAAETASGMAVEFTSLSRARTETVPGMTLEFEEDAHYVFSDAENADACELVQDAVGELVVEGSFSVVDDETSNGAPAYDVRDGNLTVSYRYDQAILEAADDEWHFIDDKTKKLDGQHLDSNILSGAVVVQSSFDGTSWHTDKVLTDVFTSENDVLDPFYTTKDIQLENGCYYRIIVAYKMQVKVGSTKIVVADVPTYETKKNVEVYQFYAKSRDAGEAMSAADTPRRVLGQKANTGLDNGYSGSEPLTSDDPHSGWNLGTFVVNGYTRAVEGADGAPVFLKNVDDRVTLWFTLEQDIDCLNGNPEIVISEDENGYDQQFEVSKTDFKRGTLIIQYTDYEGVKHDPVVYTDYLAADALTGADTRVQLFEEGDYEVALDYEIEYPGTVPMTKAYANYRIAFSFSIRNGNCMVFPRDVATGSELSDGAITPNGFKLDMARSRYLDIDVKRETLRETSNGTLTTDTRRNSPAKDGESYTEEGIYTFTVTNLYTGEHTTKTLYVGDDPNFVTLSENGWSVKELNEYREAEKIAAEEEAAREAEEAAREAEEAARAEEEARAAEEAAKAEEEARAAEEAAKAAEEARVAEEAAQTAETTPVTETGPAEGDASNGIEESTLVADEQKVGAPVAPLVILGVAAACAAAAFVVLRGKKKGSAEKDEAEEKPAAGEIDARESDDEEVQS